MSFPVRAAAVADFLQELRAHGSADLNGVFSTLNEGSLVRETLRHWLERRWIVLAPDSRVHALAGPGFSRGLSLVEFCGGGAVDAEAASVSEEES